MMHKVIKRILWLIGKLFTWMGTVISLVLAGLSALLYFSIQWMFDTWTNLSMEELVYHLNTPLDGTNTDMIFQYLDACAAPAVVLLLALIIVYLGTRGKKKYYIIMCLMGCVSVLAAKNNVYAALDKLDAESFVESQGTESTFVEDYYVSPADVALTFPEQKRNLIYIFLESMETTYSDEENGGAFPDNLIPELTQIAQENENFSGEEMELNGAYPLKYATWTIAGMFAQTSGLPLNIAIDDNTMNTQDSFFSGAITLGDILEQQGYTQTLMIGSLADFGGRELYFKEHGNYNIYDYRYAQANGWIPPDYWIFWGYEDRRLLGFAKDRLTEIAAQDQPFNFTMLTVDTHFEDGCACELCPDTYGDNQYANVMACSSAQIAEFLEWVKQQDFYENTTIVLCGDHLTMDSDFCDEVDENYERRTYTAVINAPIVPEHNRKRIYSTFDLYPTTLAAMGVQIEGNRLGLGTNLFANEPTITEKIGVETENRELAKKSEFLLNLANLNLGESAILNSEGKLIQAAVTAGGYDYRTGMIPVVLSELKNFESENPVIQIAVWTNDDQSDLQWIMMEQGNDGNYYANIDVAGFGYKYGNYHIHAYMDDEKGTHCFLGEATGIVN